MVREAHGNLLEADVDALVNTVNTVGVMGKGIALQFKRAYPNMFKAYEASAKKGEIRLGQMDVHWTGALSGPRYVINFPTKKHWRARSRLDDIQRGLTDLVRVVDALELKSIAVLPLGCGNGGLDWRDVEPLISAAFEALPDVDVLVYPPEGAPAAAAMPTRTERPRMTVRKAALVEIVSRYQPRAVEVSLIEVQRLMYFLQAAGEPLNLRYVKDRYGPYADNLRHVLHAVEGHFLIGYGDASRSVHAAEPVNVLPGAAEEARALLAEHPDTFDRIQRVLRLVDGFESAYALELLATVHWVATNEDASAAEDAGTAARLVGEWSRRKKRMFGPNHVAAAWDRLRDEGWLGSLIIA
jgi:O-acetyl-ADP-ribose deacetylase (regulator of RNase III)